MRALWLSLLALTLAGAGDAQAQAEQITTSFQTMSSSGRVMVHQAIRCDNSASIAGVDSPVSGETCESGDWSAPIDARGAQSVAIYFNEYGAGSGEAILWNCLQPLGLRNVPHGRGPAPFIATVSAVGVEPPSNAPSAADPDPFCDDLTDTVTLDGAATEQTVFITDAVFGFLVVEIQDCTGNCDSTAIVSVLYVSTH